MTLKGLNFVAHERHFFNHLFPIYKELADTSLFYVHKSIEDYALKICKSVIAYENDADLINALRQKPDEFIAVASWGDLNRTNATGLKQIYMEHGAGQTYKGTDCASYASGDGNKGNVELYLCPNDHTAAAHRQKNCLIPAKAIGCPKLDQWHGKKFKKHKQPVLAISFHWDCIVVPETRGAFEFYKKAIPILAEKYRLFGHGHPRLMHKLSKFYALHGIDILTEFDDVMEKADLYICDNSSTLFEFAATDRPVVVLNAPWYRRTIEHGLRFWEAADVGVQCDSPDDLVGKVEEALLDLKAQKDARHAAISKVYKYNDGKSVFRAVELIRDLIEDRHRPQVDFFCDTNPQLYIYNLGVRFSEGKFSTSDGKIIDAINMAIERGDLPITKEATPEAVCQ